MYCPVCKAEMGIGDASFLLPDEEDEIEARLCPICKTNYCDEDEEMCIECKAEMSRKDGMEEPEDTWDVDAEDEVVDDVDDELDGVSIADFEEEEEEPLDETENYVGEEEEDDFIDGNPDDFDDSEDFDSDSDGPEEDI